jgi:hypothetical protein
VANLAALRAQRVLSRLPQAPLRSCLRPHHGGDRDGFYVAGHPSASTVAPRQIVAHGDVACAVDLHGALADRTSTPLRMTAGATADGDHLVVQHMHLSATAPQTRRS